PLDATDGQELWLVSGSERRQITLESREIDLSVRGQVGTAAGWEHGLSLNRVRRGQSHGQRGILKWNRDAGPRGDDRRQRKRNRRGKEIVLPEIGQHCRDSSACVEDGVSSQTVVNSQTRTPALPILLVRRLRVQQINLVCGAIPIRRRLTIRPEKDGSRRSFRRFMDAAVHFVAQAVGERQVWSCFPGVLEIEVVSLATDARFVEFTAFRRDL